MITEQILATMREHNVTGQLSTVYDARNILAAYCAGVDIGGTVMARRRYYYVITLDGRWIGPTVHGTGVKSPSAVTRWVRANPDKIAPVAPEPEPTPEPEDRQPERAAEVYDPARKLSTRVASDPVDAAASIWATIRHADAAPVTADQVGALITNTPEGKVPAVIREWTRKGAHPVTLYASRFVGRDFLGLDCLLTPAGDDARGDAILSTLPVGYLDEQAAYLNDLARYAVEDQGAKEADAQEFARWVVRAELLLMGDYAHGWDAWRRALTCTMTAAEVIITCTAVNGAAVRLLCGCGQDHKGAEMFRPAAPLWDYSEGADGRHYRHVGSVDLGQVGEFLAARGYAVAGEWTSARPSDVVRRARVVPVGGEAEPESEPVEEGTAPDRESEPVAPESVECAPASAEIIDYPTLGVLLRLVCACGSVHGAHVPVASKGLRGESAPGMSYVTDWDIDAALEHAGVKATASREKWRRGILVNSHQSNDAGFATVVPVAIEPAAAEVETAEGKSFGALVVDEPEAAEPAEGEPAPEPVAAVMAAPQGAAPGPTRRPVMVGNPDESAPVVLCWEEVQAAGAAPGAGRWRVTASWRTHRLIVATHLREGRVEWFITRENIHTASLRDAPTKWRKTEQVRRPDRQPIRARGEAEELMRAHVEARRAFDAECAQRAATARREGGKAWRKRPGLPKQRPAVAVDMTGADIVAKWGEVVFEEIPEDQAPVMRGPVAPEVGPERESLAKPAAEAPDASEPEPEPEAEPAGVVAPFGMAAGEAPQPDPFELLMTELAGLADRWKTV
ncbi:hypothetical protein [Streptomyces sp. NPDC004296]|uniref:hypothetical protein n=1 Tax=Streptomyces sp. NPDC004296 TaxID=3364697 RepID=UPI0036939555